MAPKDLVHQPSPDGDSITVARDEGELTKQNQGAPVASHDKRVEQAEARTEQAETRTEQAKTRIEQAEIRTEQAEMRTEQAETRTEQAKTRTEQAEMRTEQAETRSEQAIRESELSYRRLFEAVKDGILILEADTGRISDVNPFLIDMLGFSHHELAGKPIWELGPFRDIVSNKARFEQLQQQGYVHNEDFSLETKDGRKIAVEFVSNVYQAGDRRVIQCNVRDITERKRTEAQLRASFKEIGDLKSALDEHSIVAITDPQGRITGVNDKFCAISKYSSEELLGQDHRLINSHFHSKDFIRELWATITHGKVWHGEIKNKAKDGSFYWVDATIVPFLNEQGEPCQYVSIRTDITGHKAAEEKIRQLNTELEQRVVERTAQLQAANQELDAFSYSVSHDLRAPLRHVLGFVEILKKDAGPSLSGKNLRHLETISASAKRMGNLIDDLLAFSRIGQSQMQKTEVNLDLLVQETVGDLQMDTKERNIAWEIHPLPAVRGDRALLRLVLVNLISNAVKFTGTRAEARIEIGCLTEKQKAETRKTESAEAQSGFPSLPSAFPNTALPQEETVIFIRDNGVGFDPEYAGKLFGVFQRLHSSEQFEGTGIGLANVQRIIHRHGGRVWAEGVVDGGATFFFSIPKQNEGTMEPPPIARREEAGVQSKEAKEEVENEIPDPHPAPGR